MFGQRNKGFTLTGGDASLLARRIERPGAPAVLEARVESNRFIGNASVGLEMFTQFGGQVVDDRAADDTVARNPPENFKSIDLGCRGLSCADQRRQERSWQGLPGCLMMAQPSLRLGGGPSAPAATSDPYTAAVRRRPHPRS